MHHLKLSGTYPDIGRAFGKSRRGLDHYEAPHENKLELALKCEELLKEHASDLHAELVGFSEGIGLNHQSVLVKQLLPHEETGCNLFCVNGPCSQSGDPIFVRHMDWFEADLQKLIMLETHPNDKHGALGFSFAELGCYDGINAAGLAVGSASIPFFTGKKSAGLLDRHVVRWALDNFSSVDETVEYLKQVPHAEAINFLVADKTGISARVEVSPAKVRAEVSADYLRVVNNFFMLDGTRELDSMPREDRSWEYHRRIHAWFQAAGSRIGLEHIKGICRSHENGICEHLRDPLGGTIYSWISELGTGTLHLSVGYPCRNRYICYSLS